MKRLIVVLMLCLIPFGTALAQLTGPLSGSLGPGSFTVIGDISVTAGDALTIEPGTDFLFNGSFGFEVAGALTAVGNATDSIRFKPNSGVPFWSGIEFTSSASPNSQLSYCLIKGSNDMGVYLNSAPSVTISHCTFTENSSVDMGGGCYSQSSNSSFSHCVFSYNNALHGGGLVLRYQGPSLADNLVFYGNQGTYGGAMAQYFVSGFALTNCLFYQNQANAGGGIRMSSSPSEVVNCTFAENTAADGGAIFVINQTPTGKNLIAWGNSGTGPIYVFAGGFTCTYSDIEGGFAGVGNINTDPDFVAGPGGDYYLSQIAAGQAVNSSCVDTGDPTSSMIIGTTRTDGVQDGGIVDMGYHYEVTAAPPAIDITMLPYDPPILIPSSGGSFSFNIEVANNGTNPETFDIWTMATLPNGSQYGPIINVPGFTAPEGWSGNRDRTQAVPASAPAGMYTYDGYVGVYPDDIWDEDHFDFQKSDSLDGTWVGDWSNDGEPFDAWLTSNLDQPVIPDVYALGQNYPNPFNPTTQLSFALPQASLVKLSIYDTSGRLVSTLIDGWRDAGIHDVRRIGIRVRRLRVSLVCRRFYRLRQNGFDEVDTATGAGICPPRLT